MAEPTIAARLQRKYAVISTDDAMVERLRAATPQGWAMVHAQHLHQLGEFQDVLLHRFLLLDLDSAEADPIETVHEIRTELMLNIAIFCFGGLEELRDEARLNRADRFFERSEIVDKMLLYCDQYRWGG